MSLLPGGGMLEHDIQFELAFLFITGTPNSSIISDGLNVFGLIWSQN